MTSILIVESNTPEIIAATRTKGFATAADCFVNALRFAQPDIELNVCEPYRMTPDMSEYDAIDGAVFTGSGVDWSTDAQEAKPLRDLMEVVFETGVPCFGSCNGLLLAAVVLGGSVTVSPNGREVGVAQIIQLDDALQRHPLMAGRGEQFTVPTIHRDEVSMLPGGATHLACNSHSVHQSFAYQKGGVDFWGTQYHPEMRPLDVGNCLLRETGISVDHKALAEELLLVESDGCVANRLGTSTIEMAPKTRTIELQNWLRHVQHCENAKTAAQRIINTTIEFPE